MKEQLRSVEVWFKLFLISFFILLYFMAVPYPKESKQLPQLIAQFTLIILFISLLSNFTQKKKEAKEKLEMSESGMEVTEKITAKGRMQRFYQTWAIILISTAVGFWGGFLFSSFLLFFGFACILGKRKDLFKNTLIAIGVTLVIYVLFGQIMGVPLVER